MSNAKKTFCFFHKHPHGSKMEARDCEWLEARKRNGEISDYKWQASMPLRVNGKLWRRWKVDFCVTENDGTESFWETKGKNRSDDVYALKRDAFLLAYPWLKLYVNRKLWTGKPERKSVTWRQKYLRKQQERAKKARKSYARMVRARAAEKPKWNYPAGVMPAA